MRAGQLRHKVELQQSSPTADDGGGSVLTWTTFATVNGNLQALSGNEPVVAARLQAGVRFTCVMRHVDGVRADHRLVHNGTAYQIRGVIPDGKRQRLTLELEEGVAI